MPVHNVTNIAMRIHAASVINRNDIKMIAAYAYAIIIAGVAKCKIHPFENALPAFFPASVLESIFPSSSFSANAFFCYRQSSRSHLPRLPRQDFPKQFSNNGV